MFGVFRLSFFSVCLIVSALFSAPVTGFSQGSSPRVMLGIDVLQARDFDLVRNKRVGLLTNPAGVNHRGESTVEILHRAPSVNLVALFGPEHGIYGDERAAVPVDDKIDHRTGLPVYSLYGRFRKPTPAMLRNLDVMIIDLQDIGVRSYTYVSCMRLTIEACFENDVAVLVLDRPNPLGGLKVDGPPLDPEWLSYVGAYPVPYVHGLTIGELARMAASNPGWLKISEAHRQRGNLQVLRMRGWDRRMRWTDTGLRWIPTSPNIPTVAAAEGYAMAGLGAQIGGFQHGIGTPHPFRFLRFPGQPLDRVQAELQAARIPGVAFQRRKTRTQAGAEIEGLYVQITDWQQWRPTELSFHMMRITCRLTGQNPFSSAPASEVDLFNKHVGSTAWWNAISSQGAQVPVERFIASWEVSSRRFQEQSRAYWLYR